MTNSLRIRLLWWLLVPLALYVFVTGNAEHDNARRTADLVQDNALLSSARMIAGEVEWVDGYLRVDVPPAALEMFASPYRDQVFYSVAVDGGRLLAGTPDFPHDTYASYDAPRYYDTTVKGHSIRAVGFVRQGAISTGVFGPFSWLGLCKKTFIEWRSAPCGGIWPRQASASTSTTAICASAGIACRMEGAARFCRRCGLPGFRSCDPADAYCVRVGKTRKFG